MIKTEEKLAETFNKNIWRDKALLDSIVSDSRSPFTS